MFLREIIRAQKTSVTVGKWQSGRISRSAFPLSKAKGKNYKRGQAYRWRVIRFDALGHSFRVLIQLNEGKEIFSATLGMNVGSDTRVLCVHEFHAREPGWHCHLHRVDSDMVSPGLNRYQMRRWPAGATIHTHLDFDVDESNAVDVAFQFFRIEIVGPLL